MHVCNIVILQAGGRGSLRSPPAAPGSVIQRITICIHGMERSVVNSPVKGQNVKRS